MRKSKRRQRGVLAAQRWDFVKRVMATAVLLIPTEVKKAATAAGFASHHATERLLAFFNKNEGVQQHAREAKARMYTTEVLGQALDMIAEGDTSYTSKDLLKALQDKGSIPAGDHNLKYFTAVMKLAAREMRGWYLQANSTKTLTYLEEADPKARELFAKEMLGELESEQLSLDELVFEDETTVLDSDHPKSECSAKCTSRCSINL